MLTPDIRALTVCRSLATTLDHPTHKRAIGAELMRPYVSEDAYHGIYNHQHFQDKYYYEFAGSNPNLRDNYTSESWYDLAVKLADRWDAPAFDPDFQVDSLESLEPLIQQIFAQPLRML